MEDKIFYIFKGECDFCSELVFSDDYETLVKCKPEGFYDIVSHEDTVEGGIKVIEYSEYEKLLQKINELESKG